MIRLQALVEEKEEAINDLADDLAKVRAIVAEKEKKLEELEERHSKLADYYEKDNANIKKYNQELINKNETFVEEIKQLRYQLKEKDKLIENLKTISAIKAKEMPKKPNQGEHQQAPASRFLRLSNSLQLSKKEKKARKEMKARKKMKPRKEKKARKEERERKEEKERKEMMAAKEQEKERIRSKEKKAKDQENKKKKRCTKCPSLCVRLR